MKGLCFYFDKALPVMLLYKSERQQYADAIADDVSPSVVYGAEHLLRLFGNRCSIQFYATLVLIGGFMVFIPVHSYTCYPSQLMVPLFSLRHFQLSCLNYWPTQKPRGDTDRVAQKIS
ncbi:hypothetical protein NC652_006370 [Populus alba x Populus x berolinensis]|nr:hypothetical protein NC652_006370 [Populus alba x Populus x berolinensis]